MTNFEMFWYSTFPTKLCSGGTDADAERSDLWLLFADDVSFGGGGGCQTNVRVTQQAKSGVSDDNFPGEAARLADFLSNWLFYGSK